MPENKESIVYLSVNELHDFPDHPFMVRDDQAMRDMAESTKEYGVLTPITVRPREEGGYEIISGHRRKHACELSGIAEIPAIVRKCTRDEAIIMMVDSNLQRDEILPSEKAKAYKMKLDAIKRQGSRTDLKTEDVPSNSTSRQIVDKTNSQENQGNSTSAQVGPKLNSRLNSAKSVAIDAGESRTQIQRFIRLNELIPPLQKLVDDRKMGFTPAVEISYLTLEEQKLLIETIESELATPSLSQAQRMRRMSQEGTLNEDTMLDIMIEQKKPEGKLTVTISYDEISKYFPKSYTPLQMKEGILKMLENIRQAQLKKKRNQQNR